MMWPIDKAGWNAFFTGGGISDPGLPLLDAKVTHDLRRPNKDDSTHAAAVDRSYPWIKIGPGTPLNRKLQVINRAAGVATYALLTHTGEQFWTHYALCPTFMDDE